MNDGSRAILGTDPDGRHRTFVFLVKMAVFKRNIVQLEVVFHEPENIMGHKFYSKRVSH